MSDNQANTNCGRWVIFEMLPSEKNIIHFNLNHSNQKLRIFLKNSLLSLTKWVIYKKYKIRACLYPLTRANS